MELPKRFTNGCSVVRKACVRYADGLRRTAGWQLTTHIIPASLGVFYVGVAIALLVSFMMIQFVFTVLVCTWLALGDDSKKQGSK